MPNKVGAARGARERGRRRVATLASKLTELGLEAKSVPLSGAAKDYPGDLSIDLGKIHLAEVKYRANGTGFGEVRRWLSSNDLLFLVQDARVTPLVVMPWGVFCELALKARAA